MMPCLHMKSMREKPLRRGLSQSLFPLRSSLFVFLFLLTLLFAEQLTFAQTVTLKIIETSDIHGAIFPYDFINDKKANTSLAQLQTFLKQERRKEQEVILLDAQGERIPGGGGAGGPAD